jgi:hypothetical protein
MFLVIFTYDFSIDNEKTLLSLLSAGNDGGLNVGGDREPTVAEADETGVISDARLSAGAVERGFEVDVPVEFERKGAAYIPYGKYGDVAEMGDENDPD